MRRAILAGMLVGVTLAGLGWRHYHARVDQDVAGASSCRSCHPSFYRLWSTSHHGLAMQPFTAQLASSQLNWQFSTIYQVQSGYPFTISVFGDTANSGTALGENPVRANYTGQEVFGPGTHTPEQWFNPRAFSTPAPYTFGNAGRNTVYGPGQQTLDFAIARSFSMTEAARLQVRLEAFNGLNKVNLGTPNRFVNTAQFGTITEPSTPGRQIQISARFSF